jgi:hypothetical protein
MLETLKSEFEQLAEILGLELEDYSQGEDFVKAECEESTGSWEAYPDFFGFSDSSNIQCGDGGPGGSNIFL